MRKLYKIFGYNDMCQEFSFLFWGKQEGAEALVERRNFMGVCFMSEVR